MGIRSTQLNEIVREIAEKAARSKQDILNLIGKKKKTLGSLVTDEGAALMVASDLKVKITTPQEEGNQDEESLAIGDLVAGLNGITITGRATKVSPVREFINRHDQKGTVMNVTIADKTQSINLVLWGDVTQPIQEERLKVGDIIRVHNAYVKENMGVLELNAGHRARLEINPPDAKTTDYPESSTTTTRIQEITLNMNEASVAGTVAGAIYTAKETKTKDGRTVKYASFVLKDATGATLRVVLWNEATTIADKIKAGDTVEVNSGRVRPDRNGRAELHVNSPASIRLQQ